MSVTEPRAVASGIKKSLTKPVILRINSGFDVTFLARYSSRFCICRPLRGLVLHLSHDSSAEALGYCQSSATRADNFHVDPQTVVLCHSGFEEEWK